MADAAAFAVPSLLPHQSAISSSSSSVFVGTTTTMLPSTTSLTTTTSTTTLSSFLLEKQSVTAFALDGSIVTTSTSIDLSSGAVVETIDPKTTVLSNVLGGLVNSPTVILAIPIVSALAVATLIAYLIYSYAQPTVDNDDFE